MPHGIRSKCLNCPYCKQRYCLTNFMRRYKNGLKDKKGNALWNTHLIACARKHGKAKQP